MLMMKVAENSFQQEHFYVNEKDVEGMHAPVGVSFQRCKIRGLLIREGRIFNKISHNIYNTYEKSLEKTKVKQDFLNTENRYSERFTGRTFIMQEKSYIQDTKVPLILKRRTMGKAKDLTNSDEQNIKQHRQICLALSRTTVGRCSRTLGRCRKILERCRKTLEGLQMKLLTLIRRTLQLGRTQRAF